MLVDLWPTSLLSCYLASYHSPTCDSFVTTNCVVLCTSHVRIVYIFSHGCTHMVSWPTWGPLYTRARYHQGHCTHLTRENTCQIIFYSLPMAWPCLRCGCKVPAACKVHINAILNQSILTVKLRWNAYKLNSDGLKSSLTQIQITHRILIIWSALPEVW